MAQLGSTALVQLPHQRLRSEISISGARHVQRKHRLRAGARGTHHHVLPLAVQVRIGLHQRAIHQEALLLIVPIGQPGHFLHHHVRRIGKALHPVTGAEGMHEALVGTHHHQLLTRCGPLLLLQVGTVGSGAGIHRLAPTAHALRQACIALVGGGADEDRCRVDDLAQHVPAGPEQCGLVVAVTQQVGHQLPPPDLTLRTLAGRTADIQQRLLQRLRQLIVALRTPEEVAGTHPRGAAVADNGMTTAPVRHLLGGAPLQIAFPAVHTQCKGLQVARPVTRHERRHELLVAGLQRPVADRHPGGRTRTVDDLGQDLAHRRQKLRTVLDVQIAAPAIDCSMPQVIHRLVRLLPHDGRPRPPARNDVLQRAGLRLRRRGWQRAIRTKAQRVHRHVLPERRIVGIHRNVVRQIGHQVPVPVIHGHVGQRAPRGAAIEPVVRVVRIVTEGTILARCRNHRPQLVVGIAHAGDPVDLRVLLIVVLPVGHQDVIGATAAQLTRLPLSVRVRPGPLCPVALEVLTHGNAGPQQRGAAGGVHRLQPAEKRRLVLAIEPAHAPLDNPGDDAVDRPFPLVDPAIAHADIASQLTGKGLAHRSHGQQVAETVILEPVGEVLVLLLLGAGTHARRLLPALGPVGGLNVEFLMVGNRHAPVTGRVIPVHPRQHIVGRRFHIGRRLPPNKGHALSTLPHRGCTDRVRASRNRLLPPQVQTHVAVVLVEVVHRARIRLRFTGTISIHPRLVAHLRVVIQQVHVRRSPARRQDVSVTRIQQARNPEIRDLVRLPRVDGVDLVGQIRVGQVIEQHRARIIQREHHVGLHHRGGGHNQRVLCDLGLHGPRASTGHQKQGQAHRLPCPGLNAGTMFDTVVPTCLAAIHCHEDLSGIPAAHRRNRADFLMIRALSS